MAEGTSASGMPEQAIPETLNLIAELSKLIARQTELITGQQKPQEKRLPVKAPEKFDGTYTKLRSWWEMMKDYLHINESYLPTDSLKIMTVGTCLEKEAPRWYLLRKRALEI